MEAYLETQTAPPPPPLPPPPPPGPATRVLLLAYANNWMSDGDRKKVWNWSSRATGAVVATNALARSLRSWARLDIVCIDGELDAHAERYPDGACTIVAWERFGITKGPRDAVDTLVARRTGEWDVVLCASTDESLLAVAKTSDARRTCAFVHELIELPCGPWSRRPSQSDRALEGIKLLCTSSYVRDYIELWAPRLHAVTCYAADYACFGGDVPRYAPWKHEYAVVISPCRAKGLDVLVALATRLPSIRFLAVCTRWTKERDRRALQGLRNVKLCPGAPSERMDAEVWRRTRVLLVPSLWPEPFGLVCVEAGLRGIQTLSTDLGGLSEANAVPAHVIPTSLVHDVELDATYTADGLGAFRGSAVGRRTTAARRGGRRRGPSAGVRVEARASDGQRRGAPARFRRGVRRGDGARCWAAG